jgi:hypothetical protein
MKQFGYLARFWPDVGINECWRDGVRLRLRTSRARSVNSHIWPKPGQIWGTLIGGTETFRALVYPSLNLQASRAKPIRYCETDGIEVTPAANGEEGIHLSQQ